MSAVEIATEFKMLAVASLMESEHNPRKHFDEKTLGELRDSIAVHGVLTPLLVRPTGKKFEIAAGHRRFRAAKMAGVDEVPAVIREMDDRTFLEHLTIENLQREDVHELDEANGYRELMKTAGYDVETLADKVGKSVAYIYARLKLCDLLPEIQAKFYAGELMAGHAILLARLSESSQKETVKEGLYDTVYIETEDRQGDDRLRVVVSVRQLGVWIQRNIHMELAKAPFDIKDAKLVPAAGACLVCPKRSGAAPQLFPELGKKDTCLDRGCFHQKVNAYIKEQVDAGTMVRITTEWQNREKKGHYYDDHNLAKVSGKACDDTITGIYVDGWQRGTTKQLCINKSCKTHYRGHGAATSYRAPKPSKTEQLENSKRSIATNMQAELRKRLCAAAVEKLELVGADINKVATKPALLLVLRLVYERIDSSVRRQVTEDFGLKKREYAQSTSVDAIEAYGEKLDTVKLTGMIVRLALSNLAAGFDGGWNDREKNSGERLALIAEKYGVKTEPIVSEVKKLTKEKIERAKTRINGAEKLQSSAKPKKAKKK